MTQAVYEALLNSNAMIEFNVDGQILWANQKFLQMMDYSLHELLEKNHSIFLPDWQLHSEEYQQLWQQLASGHSVNGEFKRIKKNNEIIWIQGSYTAVKDDTDKVIKVVKMAFDITEKKRLAEDLALKNRELAFTAARAKSATHAKTLFLANMSHEIRTPLNSIIGITDTLAETALNEKQASFVEILKKANKQLMMLVNDILDLSRVEAGEIELKHEAFNLHHLIEDLVSVLKFKAQEKGLQLFVKMQLPINPHFMGDPNRLRQILWNLLNNAIKFTDKGEVNLELYCNKNHFSGNLHFVVKDTGIGISKEKLKMIFKPFAQADATSTRRHGGSGIGLSITKKLVDLMQGQIWVESKPKAGSSFHFTVTLSNPDWALSESATSANTLPAFPENLQQAQLQILVVDDVEDNRNLLGIFLQNTIHKISYAASGTEALKLVERQKFDIIFMDIQMPGMDGHEATQNIRALEKREGRTSARIIACTANTFSEDINKSLNAGCDLHLSKPIRKDVLLKAIHSTQIPLPRDGMY